MTITTFGSFLEFSIPTPDIQESLGFYRELGFSELSVGDTRGYHYGVVTDGRIAIGLHADGIDEPALSFIRSDVASYLRRVTPADETLAFSRLGNETFHEIGVHTPDGLLLIMMEARTFSRTNLADFPAPVTGRSTGISLGCRAIDSATRYWADAGFTADNPAMDGAAGEPVELLAPGLQLALCTDLPPGQTALHFVPDHLDQTLETLNRLDVAVLRTGEYHRLTAPEGTHLHLAG